MRSILTLNSKQKLIKYTNYKNYYLKNYFRWTEHRCLFVCLLLSANGNTGGVVHKPEK